MKPQQLRVYFEADLVVEVDDYERSDDPNYTWDLRALAQAVQDDIGHTGVSVNEAVAWAEP